VADGQLMALPPRTAQESRTSNRFHRALEQRYARRKDLGGLLWKEETAIGRRGEREMFEVVRPQQYASTGVIQG